jgi:hypothetical protein
MIESDISAIESAIGCSLPASYREFLLVHGKAIADRVELAATEEDNYAVYPYCSVEDIVRNYTGDLSWMRMGMEKTPFADQVVFIADNGGGDYYFTYRDPAIAGVWLWKHETQTVKLRQNDFEGYFSSLAMDPMEDE